MGLAEGPLGGDTALGQCWGSTGQGTQLLRQQHQVLRQGHEAPAWRWQGGELRPQGPQGSWASTVLCRA